MKNEQAIKKKELKEKLDKLLQLHRDILLKINQERAESLTEEKLEDDIHEHKKELDVTKKSQAKLKATIKKRKQEIALWESNFLKFEQEDKAKELAHLQHEVSWRKEEIAKKEAKIAELHLQSLKEEGLVHETTAKLQALKEGIFDRPIEEDPRILHIKEQIEAVKKAV